LKKLSCLHSIFQRLDIVSNQWRTEGGVKLNPIVKIVKIAEFRTPTPQDVWKKGSKILKLPRNAIVLYYQ